MLRVQNSLIRCSNWKKGKRRIFVLGSSATVPVPPVLAMLSFESKFFHSSASSVNVSFS